jgi:hypothetical protein
MWLYLVAKSSHVGVDVDGLACPLHWPMVHSCEIGNRAYLPGVVLSCRYSGRWCLLGDVKQPGPRYLLES